MKLFFSVKMIMSQIYWHHNFQNIHHCRWTETAEALDSKLRDFLDIGQELILLIGWTSRYTYDDIGEI